MDTYEDLIAAGKVRVVDKWHVHSFYARYFEIAQQTVPREFSMLDQLVFDLKRPGIEWGMWFVATVLVILGVRDQSWAEVAGGAAIAGYMLFLMYRTSRLWRHSPVVIHRFSQASGATPTAHRGFPTGAIETKFTYNGRSMKTEVPADTVEYLRRQGHADFEAFILIAESRNDAMCFAVREGADTASKGRAVPPN